MAFHRGSGLQRNTGRLDADLDHRRCWADCRVAHAADTGVSVLPPWDAQIMSRKLPDDIHR